MTIQMLIGMAVHNAAFGASGYGDAKYGAITCSVVPTKKGRRLNFYHGDLRIKREKAEFYFQK